MAVQNKRSYTLRDAKRGVVGHIRYYEAGFGTQVHVRVNDMKGAQLFAESFETHEKWSAETTKSYLRTMMVQTAMKRDQYAKMHADHFKNPTRRGAAQRAPAANASRTRYIRRPSQITKKAPRKRLRKRRAKNFDRPTKGRFPNPGARGFVVCIQKGNGPKMHYDGTKFSQRPTRKVFPSQAIALRKAREFLAKFPTLRKYRVTVEPNF